MKGEFVPWANKNISQHMNLHGILKKKNLRMKCLLNFSYRLINENMFDGIRPFFPGKCYRRYELSGASFLKENWSTVQKCLVPLTMTSETERKMEFIRQARIPTLVAS